MLAPLAELELLRGKPDIDAVSHFGHTLRVATRDTDPRTQIRGALDGFSIRDYREMRPTVEDAFVSMVRTEAS